MPTVHLSGRALIDVAGPDAEHFLQNVLTNDFSALADGEARPGALLTPQGKLLFDYLVARNGQDAFVFECRADIADAFVKRLMLYRLRAKAEISRRGQDFVAVSWGDDSNTPRPDSAVTDRRFADSVTVVRHYGALAEANATHRDWDLLRIHHAVPESGADYALEDAFPHEILYDQNGGVGLKKGCYVGQEVVSRMHHRGTARRRLVIVRGEGTLPAPGTTIEAGGRPLGTLGTCVGSDGLAIARIDRVKEAMDAGTPITADSLALTLSLPEWVSFAFPTIAGDTARPGNADG